MAKLKRTVPYSRSWEDGLDHMIFLKPKSDSTRIHQTTPVTCSLVKAIRILFRGVTGIHLSAAIPVSWPWGMWGCEHQKDTGLYSGQSYFALTSFVLPFILEQLWCIKAPSKPGPCLYFSGKLAVYWVSVARLEGKIKHVRWTYVWNQFEQLFPGHFNLVRYQCHCVCFRPPGWMRIGKDESRCGRSGVVIVVVVAIIVIIDPPEKNPGTWMTARPRRSVPFLTLTRGHLSRSCHHWIFTWFLSISHTERVGKNGTATEFLLNGAAKGFWTHLVHQWTFHVSCMIGPFYVPNTHHLEDWSFCLNEEDPLRCHWAFSSTRCSFPWLVFLA